MMTLRVARIVPLGALLASAAAVASTFTVQNTSDSGAGSFRQAILDANANPGADTIQFAIPATGVQTISLASALPTITSPVTINGYSQPGSSANTNGPGLGDNSVHLIVIDGTGVVGADGIVLGAGSDGSTIRGLVLDHWYGRDITLSSDNNTIAGDFLGTDAAGANGLPGSNSNVGVFVFAGTTTGNVIGGTAPADRNLISAHPSGGIVIYVVGALTIQGNFIGTDATGTIAIPNDYGISAPAGNDLIGGTAPGAGNLISGNLTWGIEFAGTSASVVQGNFIGTDVTGTKALSNVVGPGILYNDASGVMVGGAAVGARNVISANGGAGIQVDNAASGIVQGNYIGTDVTGALPLGNALDPTHGVLGGVFMDGSSNVIVGGPNAGEGNVIAFNRGNGVTVGSTGTGNSVRGNSIFGELPYTTTVHPQIAIDLNADGPTANDPLDADTGSNDLQNYPIVLTAAPAAVPGSGTHVTGFLHSAASTTYHLDFYEDTPCLPHPHDYYQGQTYLGTTDVTTDGTGSIAFDVVLAPTMSAGDVVVASATDPAGNTSELTPRIVFSIQPTGGPAAGGTPVTILGTEFANGATVTIGGQPLANVVVVDEHTITGNTPALPDGTASDITVTEAGGLSGTLVKGFLVDFIDVPPNQQFYVQVSTLVLNGITVGVGGGLYGVDQSTLRQQMAVFLLKSKHGICYVPPHCAGVFADVPCPSTFADWIEQLAAEQITGGCGGNNYCPSSPVRRDQMAVFLLKSEHGSNYVPPACAGIFGDVPCPSTFANWIEQLAAEGITGGCGGGNYCPQTANTRGQMAVFLVKTFKLQ